MGLTAFPNGITSFGVPVLGGNGFPASTGSYFFVDSVNGNAGNTGDSPDAALTTVDAAINKCTADKGDVIVLMPNHSETISDATSLVPDVDGVTFWGLGTGNARPKIDMDNTASQVLISADDVLFHNVVFECSVDSLVAAIQVTGAGVHIDNCEFAAPTTAENPLIWVLTTAAADGLKITRNRTSGLGNEEAGPASVLKLVGADDAVITDNYFFGNYSVATIDNQTTECLRIEIGRNVLINENTTADLVIDLHADTEGHIHYNTGRCGDGGPTGGAIDAGNCSLAENRFANLDAETGGLAGAVST